jgi:hypothetical protein
MKNPTLLSFILIFIIFSSACTKKGNSHYANEESIVLSKSASEVVKIGNVQVQRNAYRLLNAQDKSDIWKLHLLMYLNSGKFNETQNEIIRDCILSFCSPDFFEHANKYLNTNAFATIEYKVRTYFLKEERIAIFSSIQDYGSSTLNKFAPGPGDSNCTCSMTSTYCGFWDCTLNGCGNTESGCGTLWNYPCNGTCL